MDGVIHLGDGELDLDKTMRCGQTFCWHTVSGEPVYSDQPGDEPTKYYTSAQGEIVMLWQDGNDLHFKASGDIDGGIERLLRLHEPLNDVLDSIAKDDLMREAVESHRGIRLVQDDFVPCLLSHLCSPNNDNQQIKETFDEILQKFGTPVEFDGKTFTQFPSLYELSDVSERELRRMGLGYRAKYVKSAIKHLIKGKVSEQELREMDYKEAHQAIKQINGVDDTVADKALLFALGKMEAFPLDTWAWQAVKEHYPEHHKEDDYHGTADNLRQYFGEYTGYAQEYLFHHIRETGNVELTPRQQQMA